MKIKKPNTYEIYDYAEFLKNNDQFEDSIIYFSKVLNLVKPNDYLFSKASDGRGVAYERLGDWAKAESDLLNSLKAVPNQAYVINYLGASYWMGQSVDSEGTKITNLAKSQMSVVGIESFFQVVQTLSGLLSLAQTLI